MKPKLDLGRLLEDHNVPHHNNGKWINLQCPLCDDQKTHLGWSGRVFNCYRCGKHSRVEILSVLLNLSPAKTIEVLHKYETDGKLRPTHEEDAQRVLKRISTIKLPYGTTPLTERHKKYLLQRGFQPKQIIEEWGILGTGNLGTFAHRIIIPITQSGQMVNYQGRDITDKSSLRYKSCSDNEAVVPLKNCLYGLDKINNRDWVIITEGVTKVWRLGIPAVCTFGTVVTSEQIKILSTFKRRDILFDYDEAGITAAKILSDNLKLFPGNTYIITLPEMPDVADITNNQASWLIKNLRSWGPK